MRAWGPVAVIGICFASILAGCSSPPAEPQSVQVGSVQFGAGTAGVRGSVLDSEQLPVEGALAQVDLLSPVAVDPGGVFVISGLAAGDHVIRVGAEGYSVIERPLTLQADQTMDLTFVLEKNLGTEPYLEVFHGRGYSVCDTAQLANFGDNAVAVGPFDCAEMMSGGQDNNVFRREAAASWRFIISEGTWTPSVAYSTDSMRIVHAPGDACSGGGGIQDRSDSFCYGAAFGETYTKLEAEPGKTDVNMYYDVWEDKRYLPYPESNFTFHVLAQWTGWGREQLQPHCWWVPYTQGAHHEPGCYGVGVSTGVSMDVWTSIFHWAKPHQPNECCPTTDYTATEG